MGPNVDPAFANLFMLHHELRMFKVIKNLSYTKDILIDILGCFNSEDEFQRMFSFLQKMTPFLKSKFVKC